jgi:hypothetical protein
MAFSEIADVCEWFDDDIDKYRISVTVRNSSFGPLFGYQGSFDVEWKSVQPGEVPSSVKPLREEPRE